MNDEKLKKRKVAIFDRGVVSKEAIDRLNRAIMIHEVMNDPKCCPVMVGNDLIGIVEIEDYSHIDREINKFNRNSQYVMNRRGFPVRRKKGRR